MKEVIAVIRPEKWKSSVDAAHSVGASTYTHQRVMGRGRQRGLRYMRPVNGRDDGVMQFLPKRMLTWAVPDELATLLAHALVAANRSDNYGDGKVFVCPVGELVHAPQPEGTLAGALPGGEAV